jgi:hypothetical protein
MDGALVYPESTIERPSLTNYAPSKRKNPEKAIRGYTSVKASALD